METRISATELAKGLSEVLSRVKHQREHFIVERDGEPVAEIIPFAQGITADEFLEELAKLDKEFPRAGKAGESTARKVRKASQIAVILDTSVLIDAERQGGSLASLRAEARGRSLNIVSITLSELRVATHAARTRARRRRLQAFTDMVVRALHVLAFDRRAAEVHAALRVEMERLGQTLQPYDSLIAATARRYDYEVLTRDRAFLHVPRLSVRLVDL